LFGFVCVLRVQIAVVFYYRKSYGNDVFAITLSISIRYSNSSKHEHEKLIFSINNE
jgi:hypothetical protein